MELNPCRKCNTVRFNEDMIYCNTDGCSNVIHHDGQLEQAAAAWNDANPVNDAENGQHEALQQAVVYAMFFNKTSIRRWPTMNAGELALIDLLISQGVLVEIDGRITVKEV